MIEKRGTCDHCGHMKSHCVCGRPRNTSGDTVKYNNYTDFRNHDDYAMTARINRTSSEERKIMDELSPISGENLKTFIKRTSLAERKLTEYAVTHHLYGTKRVWSCHTSSRYCFICTMAQYIEVNRMVLEHIPKPENYIINIDDDGKINLVRSTK
jgi:hypothetical protein